MAVPPADVRSGLLNPYNLSIGFFGGTIVPGGTYPFTGFIISISTSNDNNLSTITNNNHVYIDVVTPPSYGIITLDGVPTSRFTWQQSRDGRVAYTNTSATSSDTFRLWARYNEGATPLPLAPVFVQNVPSTASGDQQTGMYYGLMLVGATDASLYENTFSTFPAINNSFTVTTTTPNSVLLVGVTGYASAVGSTVPTAPAVTSISFAGLTFTRLSRQTSAVFMPSAVPAATRNYMTEVWWALAPTPVSASLAISGTGFASPGFLLGDVTVFKGLANPAAPFDTNASNFQHFITSAPPWTGMVMTPDAPEIRVLPWVYEMIAGNEDALTTSTSPGLLPRGYGVTDWVLEGQSVEWRVAGRGPAYTNCTISFGETTTDTLTDAELLFQPTVGFVDLSVEANRRKFIATGGTPAWMGSNGALPFDRVPAVYLTTLGPPLDFAENNGTGGGFAPSGPVYAASGPGCTPYFVTEAAGPAYDPQWRLTVSDDGGRTWSTLVKIRSIGKLGEYLTRLRWQKMGQSRERMIKLECTDPVRRNIVGVYVDDTQGMG
jgi:hypothetical protein